MTTFTGLLFFFREHGHWAFQDDKFMNVPNDNRRCSRCGQIWISGQNEPEAPYNPALAGSVPTDLDDQLTRWQKLCNDDYKICYEQGHNWYAIYPQGAWSDQGLHILNDNDRLTVRDALDPEKVIWEGKIVTDKNEPFLGLEPNFDNYIVFTRYYPATLTTPVR